MQLEPPRPRVRFSMANHLLARLVLVGAVGMLIGSCSTAGAVDFDQNPTCRRELNNANRSLSLWSERVESMVNESKLPSGVRDQVHNEANKLLDAIEDFGSNIERLPAAQLSKDLVEIRKRANRMALEIYLHTFDMGWPSNSLQLGVIVERVQQACLDRKSVWRLESAPNPLSELIELAAKAAGNTTEKAETGSRTLSNSI